VPIRRSLIPLALLVNAAAAVLGCSDRSLVGVDVQTPALLAGRSGGKTGLVSCSQSYASVTQVIGPKGGSLEVGPHVLYVNSKALTKNVSITAEAPSGSVRWVRLKPDGLVFQTTVDGWSAILVTSYKGCDVSTSDTPRIAQVSDSRSVLEYLKVVQVNKYYVAGLLQHFSNYAVAW
jgi:hypothetical protein